MKQLINEYKDLLKKIYEHKDSFKDNPLCVFNCQLGLNYDNRFMFYGRATNGWANYIDKEDLKTIMKVENNLSAIIKLYAIDLGALRESYLNSNKLRL